MSYDDFVEALPSADEIAEIYADVEEGLWSIPILTPAHFQHLMIRESGVTLKVLSQVVLPINRLLAACAYMPIDQKQRLTFASWKAYIKGASPLVRFDAENLRRLQRLTRFLRVDKVEIWIPINCDSVGSAVKYGRLCIGMRSWALSGIDAMSFCSTFFQMILVGTDWHILQLADSAGDNKPSPA